MLPADWEKRLSELGEELALASNELENLREWEPSIDREYTLLDAEADITNIQERLIEGIQILSRLHSRVAGELGNAAVYWQKQAEQEDEEL